jgi:YD repeat-containing protein
MNSAGHKMILALFVLTIFAGGGCKKNNTMLAGKIKSAQYSITLNGSVFVYTYNYNYDSHGRPALTQIYNYMGQPDSKITYNYNGQTLLVNYYDSASVNIIQSDTFSLNNQGYVSSTNEGTTTYGYDNNGYLVSETTSGIPYIYGYDNGNMIGVTGNEITYSSKPESRDYSFVYSLSGQSYLTDYSLATLFGRSNTNLPSMQIQSGNGYYASDTTIFSYQFDSRVSVAMVGGTTGSPYLTTTYTYE